MLIKEDIRNAQCKLNKIKEIKIKSTTGINHIDIFFRLFVNSWGKELK